tara:strand:+ start:120 stop:599 length:480 start_codon:yes stop_codon:yes gene_type:complete
MKKLIIFLAITTFFACNKSNDVVDCFYISASLQLSVFNSNNEDLLNPENPNYLDTGSTRLFYVVNGEKEGIHNANATHPKNFYVFKHENEYRIAVFLNHTDTSDKPITYIEWNNSDTDTIEVVYDRNSCGVIQQIIWLNGEQIWEIRGNTIDPYFKLIK